MQGSTRELLYIGTQTPDPIFNNRDLRDNDWAVRRTELDGAFDLLLHEVSPAVILLDCSHLDLSTDFDLVSEYLSYCISCSEAHTVVPILKDPSSRQVLSCIQQGASDILLLPVDPRNLLVVVESAWKARELLRASHNYRQQLEATNRELQESLQVLRQDQLAGRQVQLRMLPKTPQHFHDYTIAHHIVPSLYLSGDFVGYHTLMDRYLTFYFADVSGHGASSAFVTVLLRFMLNKMIRNHVIRRDEANLSQAPSGLAESLNRQFLATGLDKHMTFFAGSIDMKRHVMRYVTCAQMPAPILVSDGKGTVLPGKGKPIGLFDDASWQVEEVVLPRHFSLCMFSDGVLDYMEGESMAAKQQALHHAVEAEAGKVNGDFLQGVVSRLGLDHVQEAPDDISVLTVSREL
ncbi:serine/threonine-protein phosphatase [bacterium SCSIO 12696]|nr:serine/threonine-protein phosphatase [bacterium SCSIO 12696]